MTFTANQPHRSHLVAILSQLDSSVVFTGPSTGTISTCPIGLHRALLMQSYSPDSPQHSRHGNSDIPADFDPNYKALQRKAPFRSVCSSPPVSNTLSKNVSASLYSSWRSVRHRGNLSKFAMKIGHRRNVENEVKILQKIRGITMPSHPGTRVGARQVWTAGNCACRTSYRVQRTCVRVPC